MIESTKKRAVEGKHADQKQASESADQPALRFGQNKRGLPWVIERLILRFLDLSDLGAVCLTSNLDQRSVVRYLQTAKSLFSGENLIGDQREWQLLAFRLAAAHCRNLTQLVLPQRKWGEAEQLRLVQQNRDSLQVVGYRGQDRIDALDEVVMDCPRLTGLSLGQDHSRLCVRLADLPDLTSLTIWSLDQLHSVPAQGHVRLRVSIWLIVVFSALPKLTRLRIVSGLHPDLPVLDAAMFSNLTSLDMNVWLPTGEVTQQWQQFCARLAQLRSLETLRLAVLSQQKNHYAITLPALTDLTLAGTNPKLMAPKLATIRLLQCSLGVLQGVKHSRSLTAVKATFGVEGHDVLLKGLSGGWWPELTRLSLGEGSTPAAALGTMCVSPLRKLQHLKLMTAVSQQTLLRMLQHHQTLTGLDVGRVAADSPPPALRVCHRNLKFLSAQAGDALFASLFLPSLRTLVLQDSESPLSLDVVCASCPGLTAFDCRNVLTNAPKTSTKLVDLTLVGCCSQPKSGLPFRHVKRLVIVGLVEVSALISFARGGHLPSLRYLSFQASTNRQELEQLVECLPALRALTCRQQNSAERDDSQRWAKEYSDRRQLDINIK